MGKNRDTVTLSELESWLSFEMLRVDESFRESQALAQAALGRDLLPGEESIVAPFLEISEVTVGLSLFPVRENLLVRLRRGLQRLLGLDAEKLLSSASYRLMPSGRAGINMQCLLRRKGNGEFSTTVSSPKGEEIA